MRKSGIFLVLVAALVLAGVLPAPAFAAPASIVSEAPLAAGPIDAQIWPAQEGSTTVVIIDVTLDPSVKLPVRVRLPVPKSAVVEWAGEISNGTASQDQQRTFTLHDGQGGSYAEFTMSVSHRGQIETAGTPMTANGTQLSTQVDWVQSVPSTSTSFTVRIPAGVSAVKIEPAPVAPPDTNAAGESLYLLPAQTIATGASFAVKVAYDTSTAGASSSGVNLTAVYWVLGILIAVAIVAAIYGATHQRPGGDGADDEGDETGDDEAEPVATRDEGPASEDGDAPDDDVFDIDLK